MNINVRYFLAFLLLSAFAQAAPVKMFLGGGQSILEEPLCFMGGEKVEMEILSHCHFGEPEVFFLSKALSAPIRLEDMSYSTCKKDEGLYLHTLSFKAPELRVQQRYILQFGANGSNVLFDIYPTWLREQVTRKAAAYQIQIDSKRSGAAEFFAAFNSQKKTQEGLPLVKIVHSDHDILIQKSPMEIIWKTNCDRLDPNNPMHVLRFEALLDTLKTLNEY